MLRENDKRQTYWDIPGGRINDDETIEQALIRELREELPSIDEISMGKLLNAYRLSHNLKNGDGLMLLFYAVKATFEKDEILLSDEHNSYLWVGTEELKNENTDGLIEEGYKNAIIAALKNVEITPN